MKERRREKEGIWLSGSKFFSSLSTLNFFFSSIYFVLAQGARLPNSQLAYGISYRSVQYQFGVWQLKLLRICHTTVYSSKRGGGSVKTFYLNIHIILVYISTILLC